LGKFRDQIKILEALPYNSERFRSVRVNCFSFKDTLSFLPASLDELTQDLVKDSQHPFKILDQTNLYPPGSKLKDLLLRKGVFCYDYCESLQKMLDAKKLPMREEFYSKLRDQHTSEEDYTHAKQVFKGFKCKSLLEYAQLYCLSDVALLSEIFLQFRKIIFENFGLDCAWYISTPQVRRAPCVILFLLNATTFFLAGFRCNAQNDGSGNFPHARRVADSICGGERARRFKLHISTVLRRKNNRRRLGEAFAH
jgi:hypothetical protein